MYHVYQNAQTIFVHVMDRLGSIAMDFKKKKKIVCDKVQIDLPSPQNYHS